MHEFAGRLGICTVLPIVACVAACEPPAPGTMEEAYEITGPASTVERVLVAERSVWEFHDRGVDLGRAWRTSSPDSTWDRGAAPLGYGEWYVATALSGGDEPGTRHPATYFRHRFEVVDPGRVRALYLRAMVDDGFVFYLNGREGGRAWMPAGPIDFRTRALNHEANNTYVTFDVSAQIPDLVAGRNTLAIEVHQSAPASTDLVMDVALIAFVEDHSVRFGVAGDIGGEVAHGDTVLRDLSARGVTAFFALGDLSYSQIVPERAWCDWVHGYLGHGFPFQLLAGNHEDDLRVDGYILDFAACLPDRLGSELGPGGYAVNYASDLGPVTFIATSPNLTIGGVAYNYFPGSPESVWLRGAIGRAQAEGDWVVVGMHKNCITMGMHTCAIGQPFAQSLIDQGVDLVVQAHDHNYQRSHALATVVPHGLGAIADAGGDGFYARGAGTVFVIVGTGGIQLYPCWQTDAERGNFAAHWCQQQAGGGNGYLLLTTDHAQLTGEFIATTGAPFWDSFTIQ